LAYRPMSQAGQLLARRARAKLDALGEGLHVANTAPAEFTGWITASGDALKKARSLKDSKTSRKVELHKQGESQGRFWVEKLAPRSIRSFQPDAAEVKDTSAPGVSPAKLDASGWPEAAVWPGMQKPLFEGKLGEFIVVGAIPPADRRTIHTMHATEDAGKRSAMRAKSLLRTAATFATAKASETPHTWTYKQEFRHPRIASGLRSLELWKREPRARISVRFDRISSHAPEVLYLEFDLPTGLPMPVFSCGGVPFTPYRDQIPGSCRDYFGIDGWAHIPTAQGEWLWVSSDAPLVVVGGPHTVERHQTEPADHHRLLAMIFDNCWHTNFVADSNGVMEFQFELAWKEKIGKPADLAETLVSEPVVVINPAVADSQALANGLWRP